MSRFLDAVRFARLAYLHLGSIASPLSGLAPKPLSGKWNSLSKRAPVFSLRKLTYVYQEIPDESEKKDC